MNSDYEKSKSIAICLPTLPPEKRHFEQKFNSCIYKLHYILFKMKLPPPKKLENYLYFISYSKISITQSWLTRNSAKLEDLLHSRQKNRLLCTKTSSYLELLTLPNLLTSKILCGRSKETAAKTLTVSVNKTQVLNNESLLTRTLCLFTLEHLQAHYHYDRPLKILTQKPAPDCKIQLIGVSQMATVGPL
jgi:hypothetical protein